MSVSRRGFLQGLGVDRTHAAAFMAARGHEELVAEAMQQGGQGAARRPALPPGVEAIRISSNENPLGPGKAAIDAILGKFPEANRYPFNSTPLNTDLSALLPHVKGAGLVYICNPNNPTATINSAQEIKDFVAEVKKTSPTTAILIDEAYCDYVSDPS